MLIVLEVSQSCSCMTGPVAPWSKLPRPTVGGRIYSAGLLELKEREKVRTGGEVRARGERGGSFIFVKPLPVMIITKYIQYSFTKHEELT